MINIFFGAFLAAILALNVSQTQAAGVSDYLENKLVDHVLRGTAFAAPSTICAALLTSALNDASTGATIAEAAYTGYARAPLSPSPSTWKSTQGTTSGASTGTSGITTNAIVTTFGTPAASGPTVVSHFALLDNCTVGAGNVLFYAPLSAIKTINSGDPAPTVPVDGFSILVTD